MNKANLNKVKMNKANTNKANMKMMNKKKLLITGSTFPRYEGDTEPRFVLDLAKSLQEYADVTVLVPAAPGALEEETLEGVHVLRYHYFPIHSLETLCYPGAIVPRIKQKKLRMLLVPGLFISLYHHLNRMRHDYDIVQANWLIPQGIVQSFVKMPYVVTGHGGDVTSMNKGIMKMFKRRCIHKAQGVTAVSGPLLDELKLISDLEERQIPNQVISMGCDTSLFGPEHRVENYFHQGDDRVVLFVGRLAEKKGVRYLIEAMKYMHGVTLVIAGSGPLEQELKELVNTEHRNRKDKIQFLGSKTHEELKTIYASADIFAMPSVTAADGDKEGFGLVMLEAFASGLPVVASDSGGIKDLVHSGDNGYLVEEKDAKMLANRIMTVLDNSSIYASMRSSARKTADRYDYSVIGAKYAEFLGLKPVEQK